MTTKSAKRFVLCLLAGLAAATAVTAAGIAKSSGAQVSGKVESDGSSTLGPFVQAAAERFERANKGASVVVGISGTGGGFERFCKGEIDLGNASRPIKLSEAAKCHDAGIRYIQFLTANDGITITVNRSNTWATCLTTGELKKVWDKGSKVNSWNDVRASFPNVPLKLYGPGTDSGTFDFFTEKINGKAKQSRSDYTASEDDNVLVRGVSGDRGGLGYFGLSYYTENKTRLKAVKVDSGNGCTAATAKTVQARKYKPLSRGLFIYVRRDSFRRDVVAGFIKFIIANERQISSVAKFVPLTNAQLQKAKRQYNTAIKSR